MCEFHPVCLYEASLPRSKHTMLDSIQHFVLAIAHFYAACLVFSALLCVWGSLSLAYDYLRFGTSTRPQRAA